MDIFSCCTEVRIAKDNFHIKKLDEKKLNNGKKINKEKHNNNYVNEKTNNEKKKKANNKSKDKESNYSKNNKSKYKKSKLKKKKRNFSKNQENTMAPKSMLELKDNQWDVSNYKNSGTVKLSEVEFNNAVNIFDCENTTFVIEKDKFKSLQIQKCVKCNIVLNNLISSIEIIDSKKIKIQVLGKCSSITIDKCIGIDIYLSKENNETEFTTALSAEMNVHLENEDDWKEITIPEQFQHQLENGKLNTRVSDLYKF
ncbi:cyclase-associated protein, putative [Plasmodium relictum]|uniref:Cyclase-associated protein, putative n=1 Tax=Plasmodium relictum TaxID=85471 RepID=A0A1J1HCB7_PLARL|nr:cyclase-associated protein, putative [Plasmodium relictum]CRH03092.1 cyclase-associated protein, putative [Plasmodium relictum]